MARALNSTVITFGLVSIPCKVYPAQASERVKFNWVTPKGNRVKQVTTDAVTGEEVEYDDLSHGYEFSRDQFVTFTKDELKALEDRGSKDIAITEFVPADTVDPLWIEKAYFIGPDKGGSKGYALLAQVLEAKNAVAVAQWTTRGRQHLVVIRPTNCGKTKVLVLQQMLYTSEVKPCDEIGVSDMTATDIEVGMAGKLVDMLWRGQFRPEEYTDAYAERVREAVLQKLDGVEVPVIAVPNKPNVVDLMTALKSSIEAQATAKKKATKKKPRKG